MDPPCVLPEDGSDDARTVEAVAREHLEVDLDASAGAGVSACDGEQCGDVHGVIQDCVVRERVWKDDGIYPGRKI